MRRKKNYIFSSILLFLGCGLFGWLHPLVPQATFLMPPAIARASNTPTLFTGTNPEFTWVKKYGGTGQEKGIAICRDQNGNFLLLVRYTSSFDFSGTNLYNSGYLITKADQAGEIKWLTTIRGARIDDIAADPAGNFFVLGTRYATVYFDNDSIPPTPNSHGDVFVLKYSAAGKLLWKLPGYGHEVSGSAKLATDAAGNCYITGHCESFNIGSKWMGTTSHYSGFIVKIDPQGNTPWGKTFIELGGNLNGDIGTDGAGNCYVACYGRYLQTNRGGIVLHKFTTTGDSVWTRLVTPVTTGTGDILPRGIAVDWEGNCVITGHFKGTITIGTTTLTSYSNNDAFLVKYDPEGKVLWARSSQGQLYARALAVSMNSRQEIFMTGYFNGTLAIGDTTLDNYLGSDLFVACYDKAGNFRWAKQTTGDGETAGDAIVADYEAGCLLTGAIERTVKFDALALTSAGDQDLFIARLGMKQPPLVFPKARVNDDPYSAHQFAPAIAFRPNQRGVICWIDERDQQRNVYGQRYDSNGEKIGVNFKINDTSWPVTAYLSDKVDVAMAKDGVFVVVWEQANPRSIFAQRFDANANRRGNNFKVNDYKRPAIAMNAAGDFTIAYQIPFGFKSNVGIQKYNQAGEFLKQFQFLGIYDGRYSNYCYPAISMTDDGAYVVTYYNSKGDEYPGSWGDAIGARYYDARDTLLTALRVDEKGNDNQENLGSNPQVAMLNRGFVIVWSDTGAILTAKRYDASGNLLQKQRVVELAQPGGIALASNTEGEHVIIWDQATNGQGDIFAQRFFSDGASDGLNYRVHPEAGASEQIAADVAYVDQRIYYAWQDNRLPDQGWDIFMQYEDVKLVWRENFNDNQLNLSHWEVIPAAQTYVAEKNQRLELRTTGRGDAQLKSRFTVRGDFDLEVDFGIKLNLVNGNGLTLSMSNNTHNYTISRHYNAGWITQDGKTGHLYLSNFDGDYRSGRLSTTADDTTGKLRLTRNGNQISSFFARNGQWIQLLTKAGTTADLNLHLGLSVYDNDLPLHGWTDNVKISKGELIYAPAPGLQEIGHILLPFPSGGLKVRASQNLVCCTDYNGALMMVDVTVPYQPVLRGKIDDLPGSNVHDLWVQGHFAYTTHRFGGINMIDFANPDAPGVISTAPTNYSHGGLYSIENYLYYGEHCLSSQGGMRIYNISQGVLSKVGEWLGDVDGRHLLVTRDEKYLYQTTSRDKWPPAKMVIYDISDKVHPQKIGTFNEGNFAKGLVLSANENYLFLNTAYDWNTAPTGLQVWNLNHRTQPQLVTTFTQVKGGYLAYDPTAQVIFTTTAWGTLYVLDVAQPTQISVLDSLAGQGLWWLDFKNGYLYAGSSQPNDQPPYYLRIFRFTRPTPTSIQVNNSAIPANFDLNQNYPNPFNPVSQIRYQLPVAANVRLVIFNLLGQVIRTLVAEEQAAGCYTVNWDGCDQSGQPLVSGVYCYQLTAGTNRQTKKMLLLR